MLRRAVLAVLLACPYSLALAQGPDELWEITAQMKMGGMTMPAMPNKVCKKQGADNVPPAEPDCRTYDVKTVGNRTTWKVECTGRDKMKGDGEITMGQGSYKGMLKLKMEGEDEVMVTEYSARLVGRCEAK